MLGFSCMYQSGFFIGLLECHKGEKAINQQRKECAPAKVLEVFPEYSLEQVDKGDYGTRAKPYHQCLKSALARQSTTAKMKIYSMSPPIKPPEGIQKNGKAHPCIIYKMIIPNLSSAEINGFLPGIFSVPHSHFQSQRFLLFSNLLSIIPYVYMIIH